MSAGLIIFISVAYVGLLFLLAYYADRREKSKRSVVKHPAVYALSLAVYCTAWTYYGSVGRAAEAGLGFLPIYLGPAILAPLWWVVLRKIILITKAQHITSVADFISSRYGKSSWLGAVAALIAVVGIIPYISIQLKAIANSFDLLASNGAARLTHSELPIYLDSACYIAIALAAFTILFGTRKLDPNERHGGLVAAIAFESLIKLAAFLLVGIYVTFFVFSGFGDLFQQALAQPEAARLFELEASGIDAWEWFWLIILSMFAILLLPRQFHVGVVENTDPEHVRQASWLFPLYLLLINIFVLPIALAGLLLFPGGGQEPDSFVLSIPLAHGQEALALFAGLGGFSAATGMVIMAVIALSIMISNNLVLPLLVRFRAFQQESEYGLSNPILGIRRISIVVVLLLAYGYFRAVSEQYTLVSVGLVSFAAIAQFGPSVLGGIYWKRANKKGAMAGLLIGFAVWLYVLALPNLAEAGLLSKGFVTEGPLGQAWLRPHSLFGLEGSSPIALAAFWGLLLNTTAYFFVSLYTAQSPLGAAQADLFVDIYRYQSGQAEPGLVQREAKVQDIRLLLNRFLGEERAEDLLGRYGRVHSLDLARHPMADASLINYAETHLSGVIGAASAKIIIASVAKEDPISLEEMFRLLDQTQEAIEYSQALEKKSTELEQATAQLRQANERLKELDRLKADFVTTVTHELRTPITSIKALSKIMLENPELPEAQRTEFLGIVVSESERLARLINQVLDLEKIQSGQEDWLAEPLDLAALAHKAFAGLKQLMQERGIQGELSLPSEPLAVLGHADRLMQVAVNLIANAIKFCPETGGKVVVRLSAQGTMAILEVEDNGPGIPTDMQAIIFERFTQLSDKGRGKPHGSGLGLFITKTIVEHCRGGIFVHSEQGQGAVFVVELPLWKGSSENR
jgi:Na+/proline symporter/nitrogen-specific signal transduction histidine kinase